MPTEQTTQGADSGTTESRMSAFFGGTPEAAKPEAEAPQREVAQAEDDATATETATAEAEQPTEEPFEVDGVEYKLPPELKAKVTEWKDGFTRREDYTQKTQAVAELHRQASSMAEMANQVQHFERGVQAERQELGQIENQLKQFKAFDWSSLDTDTYIKVKGQVDNLRERAKDLETEIGNKRGQFTQWAEQKKAEVISSGQKYLQQSIKGWGEQANKEVIESARNLGYSDQELKGVFDARFVHLAWKAAQFDKLQAGKSAAVATAQKAPPVVKPGASKGPGVASEQKYRDSRAALKKSGDWHDAARAFMIKGL